MQPDRVTLGDDREMVLDVPRSWTELTPAWQGGGHRWSDQSYGFAMSSTERLPVRGWGCVSWIGTSRSLRPSNANCRARVHGRRSRPTDHLLAVGPNRESLREAKESYERTIEPEQVRIPESSEVVPHIVTGIVVKLSTMTRPSSVRPLEAEGSITRRVNGATGLPVIGQQVTGGHTV